MTPFKLLSNSEIRDMINNDLLDIHEIYHIRSTPKRWVIICPDRIYASNDLDLTIKRIRKDFPLIKSSDVSYLDAKEYQKSFY